MNNRFLFGLIILLIGFSCNRVRDKSNELIEQTKGKLKREINQLLEKDLEFRKITFNDQFGHPSDFKIDNLNGIWCDMPLAFYYGFLKYEANLDSVMNYISKIETHLPAISDTAFTRTDTIDIYLSISNAKQEYDEMLTAELAFFEELKKLETIEVYKCNRYPNIHILVVDKKTDTIYHHFQKYWD